MAHDVFVSYARENGDAAKAIVELLQDIGILCWIDNQTIAHQHGDEWAEEIVSAITSSRLMIVVLSRHANASKYVKSEVHRAFDSDLPIVPFRVEDIAPEGSLALHLAGSQWLDAFPLFEKHLDTLATSVCRLLDTALKSSPSADRRRSRSVSWQRFVTGHIKHIWDSGRKRRMSASSVRAPPDEPSKEADYRARKAAHEVASKEDVRALAKANRWWRIREIIDALETQGVPLGRFAEAKVPLERRLGTFERARVTAEDALTKLGPVKAEPMLRKLQEVVSDHPHIEALEARRKAMLRGRVHLQNTIDSYVTKSRWTAVENSIRTFALKHGQATQSLLRAAERATTRALAETRRFDLLMWTVAAGAVIIAACYWVESWLGISDGSFASRFSDGTQQLLVPGLSVIVRFGTVVTAAGFVLAMFGVRSQGTFAGVSVGLMTVAAVAQALPWASSFIPWAYASLPQVIDIAALWLPCAVFAMTLMIAMHFASSLVIGVRPAWPGATAALAAALAGYGFLPTRGISGSYLGQPEWSRWVPDAVFCASLLAVSGAISRKRSWWLLPIFAVGAGFLGPSDDWSSHDPIWKRSGPVVIGLLVAGWIAARPTTLRSYLGLLAAAVGSCITAEYLRGLDAESGILAYGRFSPLLAVWAIACGSVAIHNKRELSPAIHIWDTLVKQILRMRGARAELYERQLAESAWFRNALVWHQARSDPKSSASRPPPPPQAFSTKRR